MPDFLAVAAQTAVQTAGYLFAYAHVLVLAPLAHLTLVALAPGRRWADRQGGAGGPLLAAALGLSEPLSRRAFEANLARLGAPRDGAVYLAASHGLTAYSWVLLGPLLGKDFLISHVLGVTLFATFAAGLVWLFRVPRAGSEPAPPPPGGPARRLISGLLRYAGLAALGLGLGGLVAAWGFSSGAWAPAEFGSGGLLTQAGNAILGVGLALLGVPPVANLFVGTYLWKVGLAHAGIVAFLCAGAAAPTRWPLYARRFGRPGARRLVAALLVAALLAGLVTAGLFAVAGVEIRYKLIPQQMWQAQ